MYFYMIPMDNWKLNYKSKSLLGMGAHTYTPGFFEAKVGKWLTSSVLAWATQLHTSLSYRIRLCLKNSNSSNKDESHLLWHQNKK